MRIGLTETGGPLGEFLRRRDLEQTETYGLKLEQEFNSVGGVVLELFMS